MGSLRPGSNLAFKSHLAPGSPNARDGPPPQPQCSCLRSLLPPALETPPQRREEPIREYALGSALAPLDASPSLLLLAAARPSGRKAGSGSTGGHFFPLCVVSISCSRSPAAAAARVAARSLREALHKPSGGREASSPKRRRRLGSQHGGGGGGPGDGPRAGVRRGAALHQPLVHRRGRLRHGLVSVCAGVQARPHPLTSCLCPWLWAQPRPFPRLGLAFCGALDA